MKPLTCFSDKLPFSWKYQHKGVYNINASILHVQRFMFMDNLQFYTTYVRTLVDINDTSTCMELIILKVTMYCYVSEISRVKYCCVYNLWKKH